jgi:hypothetical protein
LGPGERYASRAGPFTGSITTEARKQRRYA